MSSSPTPPSASPTPDGAPSGPKPANEIKVISHSQLFYWWPVWFFGFIFALWTYAENYRLAIIGPGSKIVLSKALDGRPIVTIQADSDKDKTTRLLADAEKSKDDENILVPKIRVSPQTWMGPLFLIIVFLVIMITSVPLRGLWSLVTIILMVLLAVLFSLFNVWEDLLKALGDLHVFINMAGYLAISVGLFIAWLVAIYFFDRRTYAVFSPGQLRVCEEIGGRENVYDTMGLALEKRRDDWFRHIILGFGTGDLRIKTAGADRHEIVLPNVAFIAFKIRTIEHMMKTKQIR